MRQSDRLDKMRVLLPGLIGVDESPEDDAALAAGAAALREVAELRAENAALRLTQGFAADVCLSCGGDTGHEEACRGTTALQLVTAENAALRARMEDARWLALWAGVSSSLDVRERCDRILAHPAPACGPNCAECDDKGCHVCHPSMYPAPTPPPPYDPACKWGCGGTGLTRDVYGKQICPCAESKPLPAPPMCPYSCVDGNVADDDESYIPCPACGGGK